MIKALRAFLCVVGLLWWSQLVHGQNQRSPAMDEAPAAAMAGTAATPQIVELKNASFEEALASGVPDGWTLTAPVTARAGVKVEADAHRGRFAARLFTQVPIPSGTAAPGFYQEVRVRPKNSYIVSAFVKVLSQSEPDAAQMVIGFVPSGREVAMPLVEVGQNVGTYQSVARSVQVQEGTVGMRVGFRVKPGAIADVLIDDVQVLEISYALPIPSVPAVQPTGAPPLPGEGAGLEPFGFAYFQTNPNVLLPPRTTVPPTYRLGIGDVVELRYWSDVLQPEKLNLEVDAEGMVELPAGKEMKAAGLTLQEFKQEAHKLLSKLFRGVKVDVKLSSLRSIQVNVTGEAVSPGPYLLSPLSTVFNALGMAGGISRRGSFRNIQLKRGGKVIKTIDFYDFLLTGDKSGDVPLEDDDVVHVPVVGAVVTVKGEVKRPALYELKGGERLKDVLSLAGGVPASAYLGRIQVHRVQGNQRRLIRDVDVVELFATPNPDPDKNILLHDGDEVFVLSVLPYKRRKVSITGVINRPGEYEWWEGMKVKDLIERAEGLPPNTAYRKRAEVFRNNGNGLRQIIAVDLDALQKGDMSSNIELQELDELVIYSHEQVELPPQVTIQGAVRRPGVYEYTEGLTVKDLVFRVGGLLPQSYLKRAELKRWTSGGLRQLIPLDLEAIQRGESKADVALTPTDELVIYSHDDVRIPPQVQVRGRVQRPGTYEYAEGMTVRDLLFGAGSLLPDAYTKRADLLRYRPDEQRTIIPLDLNRVNEDDPTQNVPLQNRDELIVYSTNEVFLPRQVVVRGAVRRPGVVERFDGMTIYDLIFQTGLLPQAHLKQAWLLRYETDERRRLIQVDLEKVQAKDPAHNLPLQDRDELIVYSADEVFLPRTVMVSGQVRKPGEYPRKEGMRVSDLLFEAGGLTFDAYLERAHLFRYTDEGRSKMLEINLEKAMRHDPEHDLPLMDRDELRVYTPAEQEPVRQDWFVTIDGAVQRPGVYPLTEGMTIKDLIRLAGGILPGAHKVAEVGRPKGEAGTEVLYVDLELLLERGEESQNLKLQNQDRVSIKLIEEFTRTVSVVKLSGEVKRPGTYTIRKGETLYELLQRAGGLTDEAFPEGAIFKRRRELLVNPQQDEAARAVAANMNRYNQKKYLAFLAAHGITPGTAPVQGQMEIPVLAQAEDSVEAASVGGQAGQAVQAVAQAVAGTQKVAVAPPVPVVPVIPSGRVVINLPLILSSQGKEGKIVLQDGDEIEIPARPTTVSVSGAVLLAGTIAYSPGKNVRYYVEQLGGFTKDADAKRIFIVRANGKVLRAKKSTIVEVGDQIIVQSKPILFRQRVQNDVVRHSLLNLLSLGLLLIAL